MNIGEMIAGGVGVAVGGFIVKAISWAWDFLKVKDIVSQESSKASNKIGLMVKSKVLDKIKDDDLRNKMKDTIKSSADKADEAFDAGLDGISI